jgi:hypothetical protein
MDPIIKMSFECNFCAHLFTTKQSLIYHQRTAKYCLKLQGSQVNYTFECSMCGKKMLEKRQLEKHQEKCGVVGKIKNQEKIIVKIKQANILLKQANILLKQQVDAQTKQISDLQDKLKEVAVKGATKPTTSTTNILNLQPLTKEWLEHNAKNLTIEHIQRGAIGYAEFACENSFKDRVKCVDASRQILQYKEEDAVIRDKKGKKLAKKFFESIQSQNEELIRDAMDKIQEEMEGKTNDEKDHLIAKMDEFVDMKGRDLVKNTCVREEFVRELCDLL